MKSSNPEEKRRFELRQSDKVILIILAVQVLLIIALSVLQRFGLSLIKGAITLYLPIAALFVLVIWGAYVLIRRIRNRTAKIIVGGAVVLVVMVVLMLVFTYVGFVATITVPQKYTTINSPSGAHKLVVMRALDPDEERIEARKAARLEADPDGDPDVTVRDWGYVYRAYPQVMGMFYRSNADVEGEIYLSYSDGVIPVEDEATEEGEEAKQPAEERQHGTLMLEWQDGESVAHFFVQDPGIAEGGECTVRFE